VTPTKQYLLGDLSGLEFRFSVLQNLETCALRIGYGNSTKTPKLPGKNYSRRDLKVHMKRNQCLNILKVQRFKDPIPKFEPRLKKIGDFIMPESCAI